MPILHRVPPPPSLPPPNVPGRSTTSYDSRSSSSELILIQGIAPHVFPHYRGGRRLTYYRKPFRRQSSLRFTTAPCMNESLGESWYTDTPRLARPVIAVPQRSLAMKPELTSPLLCGQSDYDICLGPNDSDSDSSDEEEKSPTELYGDVIHLVGDYFNSQFSIAFAKRDPNEQFHAYMRKTILI